LAAAESVYDILLQLSLTLSDSGDDGVLLEPSFTGTIQLITAGDPETGKLISDTRSLLLDPLNSSQDEVNAALAALNGRLTILKTTLDAGLGEYNSGLNEYNTNKAKLDGAGPALIAGRKTLDESAASLAAGAQELEAKRISGAAQLESAKAKLDAGFKEINLNQQLLNNKIRETENEFIDAEAKIREGELELADLKAPEVYAFNRDDNPKYKEYLNNADQIDAISKVFPIFFLLVAALVSLTTMNRMVEEQRTQAGTMEALGYDRFAIASKYFIYANLATALGSMSGVAVGFQLFPWVVFSAYGLMYRLPPLIAPFHWDFALISTLAAMLCTSAVVWFACYSELREHPAQLMRPKPPKMGKRVILENIHFIWSRMSFIQKVTSRNIFRYKKRMFMTVIGIAGCTALMLAGYGIKDSISVVSDIQFTQLFKYDVMVIFDPDRDSAPTEKVLAEDKSVQESVFIRYRSMDAVNGKKSNSVNMIIAENAQKFKEQVTLRKYGSEDPIALDDSGAVISIKTADMLGVKVGDTLTLKDEDAKSYKVKISGITENYISHYIYMTSVYYEKTFLEAPVFNGIMAKIKDTNESLENELSKKLIESKGVLAVNFTSGIKDYFNDMVNSLNFVVLVLIVSASSLAFVVLYNLTNINVNERIREIASLKVLGFYDNEVSAYIYWENIILTVMGALAGLLLGILLHRLIIVIIAVNDLMFGKLISLPSYLWSFLLTLAFSIFVNFIVHFKLKKINMVESLKSIE
ncbi:MAG: ABC transporter permease, partial [Eubacteriaceae bacterium]|nr:ABC transporter permease [Eubacteriaceae bacterium]